MATEFLQQVQSVMQGHFQCDPILTDEVCYVDVDNNRTIVVTLLQVPAEVGMVASYVLVDFTLSQDGGTTHQIFATMDDYDSILDYISKVGEDLAAYKGGSNGY